MARKVFVSSAMSADETLSEIAETEPMAAIMWPWLLTYFDDWGRAKASPREIKNSVFQANPIITIDLIKKALQLYHPHLIQLYEVEGKWYMCIPSDKWFKFQTHIRSSKRETDASKIPAPPDFEPDNDNSAQMREIARGVAEVATSARDYTPSPSPSLSPSPSNYSPPSRIRENPFGLFETHKFGKLDDITRDTVGDDIDMYSEEWVVRAIKESVLINKISWKYVQSILERWKKTGHPEPWTLEKQQKQPKDNKVTNFPRRSNSYQQSNKPKLPVAPASSGAPMSEDEIERIRNLARRMKEDGTQDGDETRSASAIP
jgi:DnaD/phage-associated family protein